MKRKTWAPFKLIQYQDSAVKLGLLSKASTLSKVIRYFQNLFSLSWIRRCIYLSNIASRIEVWANTSTYIIIIIMFCGNISTVLWHVRPRLPSKATVKSIISSTERSKSNSQGLGPTLKKAGMIYETIWMYSWAGQKYLLKLSTLQRVTSVFSCIPMVNTKFIWGRCSFQVLVERIFYNYSPRLHSLCFASTFPGTYYHPLLMKIARKRRYVPTNYDYCH